MINLNLLLYETWEQNCIVNIVLGGGGWAGGVGGTYVFIQEERDLRRKKIFTLIRTRIFLYELQK